MILRAVFGPRRGGPEPPPVEYTPATAPPNDRWDW